MADQSHRDLQSQQLLTTNFRRCANPHTLTSKRWLVDKVLGLSWSAMLTRLSEIIANKPIKYLLKETNTRRVSSCYSSYLSPRYLTL